MTRIVALLWLALLVPSFSAQANTPEARTEKDWTVLVYLNGDNDLDLYGTRDLTEMQRVGSDARVNVVVLRDTSDPTVSSKVYYVEKGKLTVFKDYGANIDMGDWRNLVGFFEMAHAAFPAKHFLLDVWNHGSGWTKRAQGPVRGISYDDGSGNHITTPQLGMALAEIKSINEGRNLDIFGMDACLMQMSEVLYEVAESTDVVVASEEVIPADGWAYDGFLAELTKNPEMPVEGLATRIIETYRDFYQDAGGTSVQASAVDTSAFLRAQGSWNAFVSAALPLMSGYRDEIVQGFYGVQHYYVDTYVDQVALLSMFKEQVADPTVRASADLAIRDLSAAVLSNVILGETLAQSHGISIWAPQPQGYRISKSSYAELKWAKEGLWKDLLETLAYPTTPTVRIESVAARGLGKTGFVNAGNDIEVVVNFENGSKIGATGIGLALEMPAGFSLMSGTRSIDLTSATGMKAVAKFLIHADSGVAPGAYSLDLKVSVPGVGEFTKQLPLTVERNYQLAKKKKVSTSHPYKKSQELEWTITQPGAPGIRLHFSKFETEESADFVWIYNGQRELVKVLSGKLGNFWSEEVPGDTVVLRFTSDASENFYGFNMDRIAY